MKEFPVILDNLFKEGLETGHSNHYLQLSHKRKTLFLTQGESFISLNISGKNDNSFDKRTVSFMHSYSPICIWKLISYALPVALVISFVSIGISFIMLIQYYLMFFDLFPWSCMTQCIQPFSLFSPCLSGCSFQYLFIFLTYVLFTLSLALKCFVTSSSHSGHLFFFFLPCLSVSLPA